MFARPGRTQPSRIAPRQRSKKIKALAKTRTIRFSRFPRALPCPAVQQKVGKKLTGGSNSEGGGSSVDSSSGGGNDGSYAGSSRNSNDRIREAPRCREQRLPTSSKSPITARSCTRQSFLPRKARTWSSIPFLFAHRSRTHIQRLPNHREKERTFCSPPLQDSLAQFSERVRYGSPD
jgi:hypothetical protein